jgi:hypothetical protein
VERTARTQLPQWAASGSGGQQLVGPVLAVLLREVGSAKEGEAPREWLPVVVTALLDPLALAALAPEARLRVCDLLYRCQTLPLGVQDAVVALVHAGEGVVASGGLLEYLVEVRGRCGVRVWVSI